MLLLHVAEHRLFVVVRADVDDLEPLGAGIHGGVALAEDRRELLAPAGDTIASA